MNVYQDAFNLIHQYIFGNATLTSNTDLICTLLASFACIFCFSIPFVLVWKVVKMLCR